MKEAGNEWREHIDISNNGNMIQCTMAHKCHQLAGLAGIITHLRNDKLRSIVNLLFEFKILR